MTVLKYLLVLSSITFIFFGWFLTDFITDKIDSQRRHGFFHLAGFVALSIEHNKIKALSGTPQDSENTNYLHIKSELAMLRNKFNSNGQTNYCRFIYIWGLRDNKVFFYADSEPENSPDMSPPGQIYTDASPEVFKCFKDGIPFIEGPLKDKWGIWMSSIAPIRDENGKIIALLGMDTDAKEWQKDYSMIRLFVVTIIVMAYLIIICTILMCHISKKASLNHINTTNALRKKRRKIQNTS